MATAKATLENYNKMPIDAQMALSFAAGNVPASAWPEATLSQGVSWGLISTSGDDVALTKYGDDMLTMILNHKDDVNEKRDEQARSMAGDAGGAYLEKISKFDLSTLTASEWDEFLKVVTNTFLYNRLKRA